MALPRNRRARRERLAVAVERQCGFVRFPSIVYSEDGPMLEWVFNCIMIDHMLGAGV